MEMPKKNSEAVKINVGIEFEKIMNRERLHTTKAVVLSAYLLTHKRNKKKLFNEILPATRSLKSAERRSAHIFRFIVNAECKQLRRKEKQFS